jgi:hypothetical protein
LPMLLGATGIPAECAAYHEVTARLVNAKQLKSLQPPCAQGGLFVEEDSLCR